MFKKIGLILTLICSGFFIGTLYKNRGFSPKKEKHIHTQLSAITAFRDACTTACKNKEVFDRYKKDPIYTLFHENLTSEQGQGFVQSALSQQELFPFAKRCDLVGGARTFVYEDLEAFSPSTLRTLKMVADLEEKFGSLKGKHIVEIGAGSATLSALLIRGKGVASYTFVDIPESLALAKKTLAALGIQNVQFITPEENHPGQVDLVISDCTFSEGSAPRQKILFKKIIKNAPQGFLLCHFFTKYFRIRPWERDLLVRKLGSAHPDLQLNEESDEGFLATWGDQLAPE